MIRLKLRGQIADALGIFALELVVGRGGRHRDIIFQSVADPREELALLALELVESAPPGEALARDHHRHVEDQRQVGPEVAERNALQCRDRLLRDAVAAALVGVGRVGEPVADDPRPFGEPRPDLALAVLAPRGKHEQRLAEARHRLVQQQLAQAFAEQRASGLPRRPDPPPVSFEPFLDPGQMRALPRTVDAFEADEAPPGKGFGHG